MIAQGKDDTLAFIFEIDPAWDEVLGGYRFSKIHEVAQATIACGLIQSLVVAQSGAMRWPGSFRPEVLIDATGRLL